MTITTATGLNVQTLNLKTDHRWLNKLLLMANTPRRPNKHPLIRVNLRGLSILSDHLTYEPMGCGETVRVYFEGVPVHVTTNPDEAALVHFHY